MMEAIRDEEQQWQQWQQCDLLTHQFDISSLLSYREGGRATPGDLRAISLHLHTPANHHHHPMHNNEAGDMLKVTGRPLLHQREIGQWKTSSARISRPRFAMIRWHRAPDSDWQHWKADVITAGLFQEPITRGVSNAA